MKKYISFLFLSVLSIGLSFGQSNSTGGSNYYQTANLIGQSLPALSSTGGTALVYVDLAHGNDGVVDALTGNGYDVTIASSWSNFCTRLSAGHFTLAVGFAQDYPAYTHGFDMAVVSNYIHNGGKMIFATWTTGDYPIISFFGAYLTGNNNQSTITITDPAFASGLTNPFTVSNNGWGIFSTGLHAIGNSEVLATFTNGDAAIVRANRGNTILLGYLSDTPVLADRPAIFTKSISQVLAGNPVPVPYGWIIAAFFLIAAGVVFTKRKVIFS